MPSIFRSAPKKPRTIKQKWEDPAKKGYDRKWRNYSKRFRQDHPFCALCLEEGRTTLSVNNRTGVVDHKWPVSHGGPFWDKRNHWVLCASHHSGFKAALESHWLSSGLPGAKIIEWCDDPSTRPLIRGVLRCGVFGED